MIEAKITCDHCKTSIILPMKRCYEEGEWRIEGTSCYNYRTNEPSALRGWDYDLYRGKGATCPTCVKRLADEAEAKRPRTLEERVAALESSSSRI